LKVISKSFGDVDKAFNYVFKELLSIPVLKEVIDEHRDTQT